MPRDVSDLWGFVAGLDHASVMALFAHCAAQTVNALKLPWEQNKRHAHETADRLATAVALDMTAHWTPTVRSYLGRVTKAQILEAVAVGVSPEAAERIADKKKQEMAKKAEQLLAGTGWLPLPLRTEPPAWLATSSRRPPPWTNPRTPGPWRTSLSPSRRNERLAGIA